ncbi:hypothetical protein EMCG_05716 [[Emmonsia] crescens]|uniref:Uncharacterized protein n=1 Tax=[Emmonsia] crescens TaxID=73230 RepID=A0A0G2JC63_9EURO|nr:hypothetical protein EMCG_05716 [Emmonsia crescens UAMH 3008]
MPHGSNSIVRFVPLSRGYHSTSNTASQWETTSISVVSKALPGLEWIHSCGIPVDLLLRGATPRKRWGEHGEVIETDARYTGLVPELVDLLSNPTKVENALSELQSLSAISRNSDHIYSLNRDVLPRVLGNLPLQFHPFWRLQALIIAFRSIPWKYLNSRPFDMDELFTSHVRHTLQGVQNNDVFQVLTGDAKTELILTLIEASRFPGMEWKRFAVNQTKETLGDINDKYFQSYIAQRECLLYRITGDMTGATRVIENAPSGLDQFHTSTTEMVHAGFRQTAIQRSLNHIQAEELTMATSLLDAWQPLRQSPSAIKEAVLFHKHVLLSKISRFQGKFKESLEYLMIFKNMADCYNRVLFNEDQEDLLYGTLAKAKPDHFYGARPEQLNHQICEKLSDQIIPSTQNDLPITPNFFLEAKGPDGSLASYQHDEPVFDNNAYTVTSTYHGSQLKLYTTHPTAPRDSDDRPEYIMTQLKGYSMTDHETFLKGASAYRNARDWAKEQRDKAIQRANERFSEGQPQPQSTSQQTTSQDGTSNLTVTLDDSDASTVSETEFHNAQWSFAALINDKEEEPQILSRNAKKLRVANVSASDTG